VDSLLRTYIRTHGRTKEHLRLALLGRLYDSKSQPKNLRQHITKQSHLTEWFINKTPRSYTKPERCNRPLI